MVHRVIGGRKTAMLNVNNIMQIMYKINNRAYVV